MAVVAAGELDDLGPAGEAASVPELTSRIRSTGATRPMISAASSLSAGVGAPNDSPEAAALATASTTAGCA
jgi:hypothetical protein